MVAVCGIGYLPVGKMDPADVAKLLYVAMARSTENLLLTSHRKTAFLAQMRAAIAGTGEILRGNKLPWAD